jgi:uncharacterized membrane protein YkvA (DUF1232 family)
MKSFRELCKHMIEEMKAMSEDETASAAKSFYETLVGWLASLPTDIKVLIEMIGDNELAMKARTVAVGALVYMVAPISLIPNVMPVLGYIDDVLVLHIALAIALQIDSSRADYYRNKYPRTVAVLSEQMELVSKALGALYSWLLAFVESLSQRRYKGKSSEETASSEDTREEIFDEAMEYAASVYIDEKDIRLKLLASPPNQLANLLSDGLEKEQERQAREEKRRVGLLAKPESRFRRLLG